MIRIGTPLHLQGLRFQTMERFPEPTERNMEQHGRIEKQPAGMVDDAKEMYNEMVAANAETTIRFTARFGQHSI